MGNTYCTTYCNHGHRLSDGKPVDHECHVLPPKALQAERDGDYEQAINLIQEAKPLKAHRGVRQKHEQFLQKQGFPKCICEQCLEDQEA